MNKTGLFFLFVILFVYFAFAFSAKSETNLESKAIENVTEKKTGESTDLVEETRTRKKHGFYGLHHYWGWHALAIAYFIKIKVVIVAFFLGSAFFWGLRYFWPHKCNAEIVRESPIIYDHPPISYSHHDHIPYSLDHSGPYSDHSYEATASFDSISSTDPYSYSAPPTSAGEHRVKRDVQRRQRQKQQRPTLYVPTEEQIAEFMFTFLGLDSKGCRRRFICEMEFRSKLNPLTNMAFRIVGRSFFGKYTNAFNKNGRATSFQECAAVNPDCTVIEENFNEDNENQEESNENEHEEAEQLSEEVEQEQEQEQEQDQENQSDNAAYTSNQSDPAINTEQEDTNNPSENEIDMDKVNEANLAAERRDSTKLKQRRRGRIVDIIIPPISHRS